MSLSGLRHALHKIFSLLKSSSFFLAIQSCPTELSVGFSCLETPEEQVLCYDALPLMSSKAKQNCATDIPSKAKPNLKSKSESKEVDSCIDKLERMNSVLREWLPPATAPATRNKDMKMQYI